MDEFIQVIQQDLRDKGEKLTEEKADSDGEAEGNRLKENKSVPEPAINRGAIVDQLLTDMSTEIPPVNTGTPVITPNSATVNHQSQ